MDKPANNNWMIAALWHALVIIAIVLIPSFVLNLPPWKLLRRDLFITLVMGAGYVGALLISVMWSRFRSELTAYEKVTVFLAVFGLIFLYFLFFLPAQVVISQPIVLATFVLLIIAFATYLSLRSMQAVATGLLAAAVLMAVATNFLTVKDTRNQPAISTESVNTSLYTVAYSLYRNYVPKPAARGGGFQRISDRILLVSGEGAMYLLDVAMDHSLHIDELPHRVPINIDAFTADAIAGTDTWRFRVSGVLVDETDSSLRLYAVHHFWKPEQKCFVMRVSVYEGTYDEFALSGQPLQWNTIFESQPCLKLREYGMPFSGHESGGRIVRLDERRLLLSTGQHGWDGYEAEPAYSQLDSADYGKLIEIDAETFEATIVTKGHKNPQGLLIGSDQRIWSTEHGPQGGDELNRIVPGANYGWPNVTFGTDYGSHVWPANIIQGRHDGYEQPVFAWLEKPGVGISNLIELRGDSFELWRGDLLIGSLKGASLFRVRLNGNRVTVVERMKLSDPDTSNFRIRDLIEIPDGRLLLWLDSGTIATVYPSAEPSSGKGLFAVRCGGCHAIADGQSHGIGPDLRNVVRRDIAATDFSYSPALESLPGKWTKAKLAEFLANPGSLAPGTSMVFAGIEDEDARSAIIDFLVSPD